MFIKEDNLSLLSKPPSSPVDTSRLITGHSATPEQDGSSQSVKPSPSSSKPFLQSSCGTGAVGHLAPSFRLLEGPKANKFDWIIEPNSKFCTSYITYTVPVWFAET